MRTSGKSTSSKSRGFKASPRIKLTTKCPAFDPRKQEKLAARLADQAQDVFGSCWNMGAWAKNRGDARGL